MKRHDYLKRLPREHYQGDAYVHWTLTTQDRSTGWLSPPFYYKFRELLTHTIFRYGLVCPIYCCMPDHIHMLWMGLFPGSDQLNAMKYFRKQLNLVLKKIKHELQPQAYDNVLKDDERASDAFAELCEYIARNPERAGLVATDHYAEYRLTDCLIPGAPEVSFFDEDYWDRFWTIHHSIRKGGLLKDYSKKG